MTDLFYYYALVSIALNLFILFRIPLMQDFDFFNSAKDFDSLKKTFDTSSVPVKKKKWLQLIGFIDLISYAWFVCGLFSDQWIWFVNILFLIIAGGFVVVKYNGNAPAIKRMLIIGKLCIIIFSGIIFYNYFFA